MITKNSWKCYPNTFSHSTLSQLFTHKTIKIRYWKDESLIINRPLFDTYPRIGNGLVDDGYFILCWLVCSEPIKYPTNTQQRDIRYWCDDKYRRMVDLLPNFYLFNSDFFVVLRVKRWLNVLWESMFWYHFQGFFVIIPSWSLYYSIKT